MRGMLAVTAVVAGLGVVAVAGAVRQRQSCGTGAQCAAPTARASAASAPAAQAGSRDPIMSLMCQGSCAAKEHYTAADLVAQPAAHADDLTRCPVSGVVFRIAEKGPHAAYAGQTYHFCCDNCVEKFAARPAHYLEG